MTKEQFRQLKIGDKITLINTIGFSYVVTGKDTYPEDKIYIAQTNTKGWIQEILEKDAYIIR